MFSKKRIMAIAAISCVIVLFVFVSSQLSAFGCTGTSACGSCRVTNCESGGCVSSSGGAYCLCDGLEIEIICAIE
jgi:hypothetical protein